MPDQALDQRLIQLEEMLLAQQDQLKIQQAELATLREALALKTAAPIVSATSPEPIRPPKPEPSRRQMLRRMGLAVLAGGAALGIASATYAPAEAKLSVNPSSNVGAVVTRIGASLTNIPTMLNVGLLASPDTSLDAGAAITFTGTTFTNVGISGLTGSNDGTATGVLGVASGSTGRGVRGYGPTTGVFGYSSNNGVYGSSDSETGTGVYGNNNSSGRGVKGFSSSGIAVVGETFSGTGVYGTTDAATSPAINAKNTAAANNGIALQIEQGGLTVKGAGIGTQTAAFVHQSTTSNTNTNSHVTTIDNPLCNGRPNALLFVTHNYNPPSGAVNYDAHPIGVFYGSNKWNIYHEDLASIVNLCFNVLVINS